MVEQIKELALLATEHRIRVIEVGSIRIEMDDTAFPALEPLQTEIPKSLTNEPTEDELTFWSSPLMDDGEDKPKEGA